MSDEKLVLSIMKLGAKNLVSGVSNPRCRIHFSPEDIEDVKIVCGHVNIIFNRDTSNMRFIFLECKNRERVLDYKFDRQKWTAVHCHVQDDFSSMIMYHLIDLKITYLLYSSSFEAYVIYLFRYLFGLKIDSLEEARLQLVLMGAYHE